MRRDLGLLQRRNRGVRAQDREAAVGVDREHVGACRRSVITSQVDAAGIADDLRAGDYATRMIEREADSLSVGGLDDDETRRRLVGERGAGRRCRDQSQTDRADECSEALHFEPPVTISISGAPSSTFPTGNNSGFSRAYPAATVSSGLFTLKSLYWSISPTFAITWTRRSPAAQ